MKAHQFTYVPVVVEMNGEAIELEVHGEIDSSGKVFLDLLYYKAVGSVYSTDMHDLLKIQPVFDSIANQIKGRK